MTVISQFRSAVEDMLGKLDDDRQLEQACDVLEELAASERPNRFAAIAAGFKSHDDASMSTVASASRNGSVRRLTKNETSAIKEAITRAVAENPGSDYIGIADVVLKLLPWVKEAQKSPSQTIRDNCGKLAEERILTITGNRDKRGRPNKGALLYLTQPGSADTSGPFGVSGHAAGRGTASGESSDTETMLAGEYRGEHAEDSGVRSLHLNGSRSEQSILAPTDRNGASAGL